MTATIRSFRPEDRESLVEVCVRTADAGSDATGMLSDDALWPTLFLLPYVERHPELAFTVEHEGEAAGYLVCAPDTVAFEHWFRSEWWPAHTDRWPHPGDQPGREADLVRGAYRRGETTPAHVAEHLAHFHIDLLPELQGRGSGRALIARLEDALRDRGVPGVHLGADPANTGALAFYDRLGFARLPVDGAVFAKRLV